MPGVQSGDEEGTENMIEQITYLVALSSMVGTVANSFQKKWCFYIWICTNVFWFIYNAYLSQYAQAMLYLFNFVTCILGLIKWKKMDE